MHRCNPHHKDRALVSNVKRMFLQLACGWEAGHAATLQGSAPVKGAGAAAAKPRGRLLALRAALNALTAPADRRRRRRRRHAAGVAFGAPRMLPRMCAAGLVGPARLPGRRGSPATSVAQLVLLQGDQRQPSGGAQRVALPEGRALLKRPANSCRLK